MARNPRVEPVIGLRAAPDAGSLSRLSRMVGAVRASMQPWHNAYGPDRGDPAVTFNGPVAATPSPTEALARIGVGSRSVFLEPSDYSDAVPTDTSLDPYRAILFHRQATR